MISVIWTITTTQMIAIETQEITDATAWRCLVASERTNASLSAKPTSSCRVTSCATQETKRAASTAPISSMTIRRPRVMIQSPMSPRQKSCQRCVIAIARKVLLVVISPVAPPDPRFQEPVDVSVQNGRRIAHLVLGSQILDHLVRVQYIGAHLVTPGAAALTFQRVQLSAL